MKGKQAATSLCQVPPTPGPKPSTFWPQTCPSHHAKDVSAPQGPSRDPLLFALPLPIPTSLVTCPSHLQFLGGLGWGMSSDLSFSGSSLRLPLLSYKCHCTSPTSNKTLPGVDRHLEIESLLALRETDLSVTFPQSWDNPTLLVHWSELREEKSNRKGC